MVWRSHCRSGARRLPHVRCELPRRRGSAAREQVGRRALAGDHRLRQLTHDPERERLLKLAAPGLQRAPT